MNYEHTIPMREAARYPAKYHPNGDFEGHEILVQLRLPAALGGVDNGLILTLTVLNDTGATIATIYRRDWDAINVNKKPPTEYTNTLLADGRTAIRETVTYQTRLVSFGSDGNLFAITSWIVDKGVIVDNAIGPQELRLSGAKMRNTCYFLTSPKNGNNFLYVAASKDAMVRVLQSSEI